MQQNPHPGSVTSPTVPIRSETGLGGQAPSLLTISLVTSALIQNSSLLKLMLTDEEQQKGCQVFTYDGEIQKFFI